MKNSHLFVMDTNALVSAFLLSHSVSRLAFDKAADAGMIATSNEAFAEFREVFLRKKFNKYLPLVEREEIVDSIDEIVVFFAVSETITDCRDPKDNKFLELAVSANASCIITGDEDLLVLHPYRKISIMNASSFVNHFAV